METRDTMQVKIRKSNQDGVVRLETTGDIKEVLINEDILHPQRESVSVCFKGGSSSGIIDFTPAEIESVYKAVRKRLHLIKGFKVLQAER